MIFMLVVGVAFNGISHPVVDFLGCRLFTVMGKLTFAAYLLHPGLIYMYYASMQPENGWFTPYGIINLREKDLYWVTPVAIVVSYVLATVVFLFVEQPAANLVGQLFGPPVKAKP